MALHLPFYRIYELYFITVSSDRPSVSIVLEEFHGRQLDVPQNKEGVFGEFGHRQPPQVTVENCGTVV